jgi:sugar phosphate permease
LKSSPTVGGLGLSPQDVGWILASLKIAYAVGQLVNGQLAERCSPRQLLAIGMFGSAALNIFFGFSTGLYFLIFAWAANGYCQSLGWTPSVRVIANWTPVERRGEVIGFIGTGYQAAGVLSFVVAGQAAEHFGWRGAFFVPAALLAMAGIVMLWFLEESPTHGDDNLEQGAKRPPIEYLPIGRVLYLTLTNPALWLLGISLGLLDACRYGFVDWGLTHLKEVQETGVGMAALKYAVLPAGGIAGAFLAGWVTDRYFGSRRAPVACVLLALLGGFCLMYDSVARTSVPATIVLLVLIGFCIFGPQVLLVGTAPADLAKGGTSAAAAGFVNAMGYAGAACGDYFTGRSLASGHWESTIYLWAAWAFGAAAAVGLLWNVRPKPRAE